MKRMTAAFCSLTLSLAFVASASFAADLNTTPPNIQLTTQQRHTKPNEPKVKANTNTSQTSAQSQEKSTGSNFGQKVESKENPPKK